MYKIISYTEERENLDVRTIEIASYLKRPIRYTYRFDERTGEHLLLFEGLWKYWLCSEVDKAHPFFLLPSKFVGEQIPDKVLDKQLTKWQMSLDGSLAYKVDEKDRGMKYNWMLGVYLRSISYQGYLGDLITHDPQLLNYKEYSTAFDCLKNLLFDGNVNKRITEYAIPNPPRNKFMTNEITTWVVFVLRFNENDNTFCDYMRRQRFACSHVTWHWNVPHFFRYCNDATQIGHVYSRMIEDWRMYLQLDANSVMSLDRPSERLIVFGSSDVVREISAVASMYPDNLLHQLSEGVLTLDSVYKAIRLMKANGDVIFNKRVARPATFYMTSEQYKSLKDSNDIFKIHYDEIVTTTVAVRRVPDISSKLYKTVKWELNTLGDAIDDEPIIGDMASTSVIEHKTCRALTDLNLDWIFDYMLCKPAADEYKDEVPDWYSDEYSKAVEHFNNLFRFGTLVNPVIKRIMSYSQSDGASSSNILYGSRRHLFMQACFKDLVIVDKKRMVHPPETTTPALRNNSTFKMLGCYLVGMKFLKEIREVGNRMPAIAPINTSILFLGAEDEPAINILNNVNQFAGNNVRIRGIGDRGNSPNLRAVIPDIYDSNVTADVIISDIDFDPTMSFEDTMVKVLRVIDFCIRRAEVSIVKLNKSCDLMLNKIIIEIERVGNYRVHEMRLAAQNLYTIESFVVITSYEGEAEPLRYFENSFGELDVHHSRETDNDDDLKPIVFTNTLPLRAALDHPSMWDELINDLTCKRITMRVNEEDIVKSLNLFSTFTNRVETFRYENTDGVYMLAYPQRHRLALSLRSNNRYGDSSDIERSQLNGMGKIRNNVTAYGYETIKWYAYIKSAVLELIHSVASNLIERKNTVASIGGRDLTEIKLVPVNKPYIVIDPLQTENEELTERFRIEQKRTIVDFNNLEQSLDGLRNAFIFCLNVIMTDVNGAPVSKEGQLTRLKNLNDYARAHDCVVAVNYYDSEVFEFFEPDCITNNEINIDYEHKRMSFGDYTPVDTLSLQEISTALVNNDDVNAYAVTLDNCITTTLRDKFNGGPRVGLMRLVAERAVTLLILNGDDGE